MMMKRRSRYRFKGQGIVEFALVGPIFFLMLLGTIEMGRAMWINHEVSNAAREGARWAAVRGAMYEETAGATPVTNALVEAVILDRTSGLNDADLSVTVTWDPDREPGSTVTVVTTYQYTPMIGGFLGINPYTMTRQSVMTVHY